MIDYETYQTGDTNDITVVNVTGRVDNDTSDFFYECVASLVEDGATQIILDFQRVEFISSLGLGKLVGVHSSMKKLGGEVKLCSIRGVVADVLRTVGLDRVFHIYANVDAAREAFAS